MVFVASDDGFTIQMENALVKKPWSDFLKWKEGKTLFVVYISDNMFQLVPKRFFSLPEDVTSFRNLLNAKVAAR